jgi:hypothetical protein
MKITIENKENQHIYTAELPAGVSLDEILDKVYLLLLLHNYYPTKSAIEKSAEEFNDTMRMLHEEEK